MSKEALRVMADWVAAIADNVKNPIASIGAALDHTEGHLHDPKHVRASISQIRRRLHYLNEYVSELVDFARPAVINPCASKIKVLVSQALQEAALPKSCVVDVDMPAELSWYVDSAKMQLVLKALLRNAFEAVDARQVPYIRLTAPWQHLGNITVAIEDNGPGLKPEIAERALEPFYTTKEAGTGLGLTITRKYIEAHKGMLAIKRSLTLGGCCVELTLPDAAAESKEDCHEC